MTQNPLVFRPESVRHAQESRAQLGKLLNTKSIIARSHLRWIGFLTGASILVALGTFSFPDSKTLAGQIEYDQSLLTVSPVASGTILFVHVREGEHIAIGAPIATISAEQVSSGGARTLARISGNIRSEAARVQQQLAELQNEAALDLREIRLQKQKAADEINFFDSGINNSLQRLKLAKDWLAKLQELESQGYMSALYMRTASDDLLEREASLEALRRGKKAAQSELSRISILEKRKPIEAMTAQAPIIRELQDLNNQLYRNEASRETQLVSKVAGFVKAVRAKPGQEMEAGQPVALLAPDGAQILINLIGSSAQTGQISLGNQVNIRVAAFPFEKFGQLLGTVSNIRPIDANRPRSSGSTADAFEVTVKIEARPNELVKLDMLRHGMSVEADVILNEKSLLAWIVEPFKRIVNR